MAKPLRCAIYTRKSTEEGLEQDFNSLDAQREACAAFVMSQRHEGWSERPDRYDDGGFSGGSMDRPALAQLLADIEAGTVDVVVVYKVDRLTRSLADFARIVAIFDAAGVSFVSVTQQFNTTTSMGRLTLNVLLSFAQFEREVTAERIRDKIAASKARGMWMGGVPPIGYRAENRQLVVEPKEADLVRHIFARYLALGSVLRLKAELEAEGRSTPLRVSRTGRTSGGCQFSRGKLYWVLSNPVVIGQIRHRDKVYDGQHGAIVDRHIWDRVQAMLSGNRRNHARRSTASDPSPLAGRLFDPEGSRMRPVHAKKGGRRYRYYVSPELIEGSVETGARGWRIPGAEIEAALANAIRCHLAQPETTDRLVESASDPDAIAALLARAERIRTLLQDPRSRPAQQLLRTVVHRVALSEQALTATIDLRPALNLEAEAEFGTVNISASITLKRRGAELKLTLQGAAGEPSTPDPNLIETILTARRRFVHYTNESDPMTISEIAAAEGADTGDVSRSLQLAFLAPDLAREILDGRQSVDLTATRLKRIRTLPLLWEEQRAALR